MTIKQVEEMLDRAHRRKLSPQQYAKNMRRYGHILKVCRERHKVGSRRWKYWDKQLFKLLGQLGGKRVV